jgi:aminopeptidase YwaD
MLKKIMDEFSKETSGDIAKQHVEQICRYHRIQASPGYREAARWCKEALENYGLDARLLEYPADGKTMYWTQLMFKEWSIGKAELKIVEPKESAKILARFSENRMSIIQRSSPTPPKGVNADLVVLENGEDPREYERLNVRGKIVLTSGDVERVRSLAVDKHGAIGIVTDRMAEFLPVRQRTDLPDALQYTSFWWQRGQKPCFGFVISPRQGNELRKLIRKQRGKKALRLHTKVNSRFYAGKVENVTAVIKGRTEEEVLVVAHLCHPQPSANDNASGCGTVIEVARTLQKLVSEKRLPRPKRTIRFLLGPEMTGTYAYLATSKHAIRNTVAAINLDMVGENQELCKSPLLLESPPQATNSYVADLLEAILERVSTDATSLSGTSNYALFKQATIPFSGGSDHYILSDPTVGIPCPMIIQWPDKFYHTSEDTIDKVDPDMLRRVALLTGTYAFFIANAGFEEAVWLANESLARFKRTIALSVQRKTSELLDRLRTVDKSKAERRKTAGKAVRYLGQYIGHLASREIESIKALSRLVEGSRRTEFLAVISAKNSQINSIAEQEYRNAIETLRHLLHGAQEVEAILRIKVRPSELERKAMQIVPKRKLPGPINMRFLIGKLESKDREELRIIVRKMIEQQEGILPVLALYWTDGKRTLKAISDLVYMETGKEALKELLFFFNLLEKTKLVEIRKA